MRKTFIIIIAAMLSQACVTSYTDMDVDESPQEESVDLLHRKLLYGVFGAIELADFFDCYQAIRTDREAAIQWGHEYFGEFFMPENLVYENYTDGYRGRISLTSVPGIYTISHVINNNWPEYHVKSLGDRRYLITTKPQTKSAPYHAPKSEIKLECCSCVDQDGVITVESMEMNYMERTGKQLATAEIKSTADPVMRHLVKDGSVRILPFSGTLRYRISGKMFHDEFTVQYSNGKFGIL